jgi:hypothetical protein
MLLQVQRLKLASRTTDSFVRLQDPTERTHPFFYWFKDISGYILTDKHTNSPCEPFGPLQVAMKFEPPGFSF